MKILVADDDLLSRMLLQKLIEKLGYSTGVAEDGKQAFEMLKTGDYRMVISDWMMPEMDGVTLCRKIRERENNKYIYIILLTAKDRKGDIIEGLNAGADDYMIKPFVPEELHARMRTGERVIGLEDQQASAIGQLLQAEKMASIGQLAAGVAHEINNPTGFVNSNLRTLQEYQEEMRNLIALYKKLLERTKKNCPDLGDIISEVEAYEKKIDIDYLMEDGAELIGDCQEGTDRIKKIVMDLKDFAHPGEDNLVEADVNAGIESTLNVVWNELKYKTEVEKEYGDIPLIPCYPQQLNQVFMNLLVNAAQAIEEKGVIRIRTRVVDDQLEVVISDTGSGIPQENLAKIFDPFFTTKEVGKGTGLGLNVAYNIVKKHRGDIQVESEVNAGTTFTIRLPL